GGYHRRLCADAPAGRRRFGRRPGLCAGCCRRAQPHIKVALNELSNMSRIEIYTTRYCPYCHAAKRLLSQKGVEFREIDVSGDAKGRNQMVTRANGRMTVPQIFI